MGQYYLRVEAVNLNNFVYDTKDLSTIRGGGLLLLNAVDWIAKESGTVKLTPVMTGASAGLYQFEAETPKDAKQVPGLVLERLVSLHPELKHASFVADIQVIDDESGARFNQDLQRLIAKNRWQQMQSPALAVPAQNAELTVEACRADGVRPGDKSEGDEYFSKSVHSRRSHGRKEKQNFYAQYIEESSTFHFTNDLEVLTNDPHQGNLHHKMAVIYLDGNNFGKVKRGENGGLKRQKDFDVTLKEYRREMLRGLLKLIDGGSDWKFDDELIRMETLLWGGDEILWVVPAWKGWEVLSYFFRVSKGWRFEEEKQLHHGGGMVFCHHNAPIFRIKALAHDLAELAKDKDRRQSLFAYEILESFDHVGRDLDAYRKERSVQPLEPGLAPDPKSLILAGHEMNNVLEAAKCLKEKLPRRKLHVMAEDLLCALQDAGEIKQREKKRKAIADELLKSLDDEESRKALGKLTTGLGGEDARWLHLSALWDYMV